VDLRQTRQNRAMPAERAKLIGLRELDLNCKFILK
jgi:hypothetical protein